jgi:hypothetical protein
LIMATLPRTDGIQFCLLAITLSRPPVSYFIALVSSAAWRDHAAAPEKWLGGASSEVRQTMRWRLLGSRGAVSVQSADRSVRITAGLPPILLGGGNPSVR